MPWLSSLKALNHRERYNTIFLSEVFPSDISTNGCKHKCGKSEKKKKCNSQIRGSMSDGMPSCSSETWKAVLQFSNRVSELNEG